MATSKPSSSMVVAVSSARWVDPRITARVMLWRFKPIKRVASSTWPWVTIMST